LLIMNTIWAKVIAIITVITFYYFWVISANKLASIMLQSFSKLKFLSRKVKAYLIR